MLETPDVEFRNLTSLHLGGKALSLLEPESDEDLARIPGRVRELGGRPFYIGRGTNLLASSEAHDLVLVSMKRRNKLWGEGGTGKKPLVYADAGVPLSRLLRFCARNGYSGLEGLVGIPGNVGGACAMNAGSFGVEIGAVIHALKVWDGNALKWVQRDELNLSYRSLKLANGAALPLICGAIFALTSAGRSVILQLMHLNFLKKKSGQPLDVWTAGCAFKNPSPDAPAGRLLEEAGFRGKKLGGMYFSPRHANFLVNAGNGTPEEAFGLLENATAEVKRRTGIELSPEIQIVR